MDIQDLHPPLVRLDDDGAVVAVRLVPTPPSFTVTPAWRNAWLAYGKQDDAEPEPRFEATRLDW